MVNKGDKGLLFRNQDITWLEESGSASVGDKGFLVHTDDDNYFLRETSVSIGNKGRLFNIDNQYYLRSAISVPLEGIYAAGYFTIYNLDEEGTVNWSYIAPDGGYAGNAIAVDSDDGVRFGTTHYSDSNKRWIYDVNIDGSLNWSYHLKTNFGSGYGKTGLEIDSNDNLYIGCTNDFLVSLDDDGVLNWSYKTINDIKSGIALSSSADTVYCGDKSGFLLSIKTADGSLNWSYKSSGEILSEIILDANNNIYFCGGYFLNALDSNGMLNWSFRLEDVHSGGLAFSSDESFIYSGDGICYIHAIDTTSGGQNWSWHYAPGSTIDSSIVVDDDDNIYFGHLYGFVSLDSGGLKRWDTYDTYAAGGCSSGVALFEDHVFFVSYYDFWDVSTENGTRNWSVPLDGYVEGGAGVAVY